MDGERFDRLARSFANGLSRRRFLGGLAAAAVPARLLGSAGADAAACRAPGQVCRKGGECCSNFCGSKDKTGRRRCACPAGATVCGPDCADLASDITHCGDCGTACPANHVCNGGACKGLPGADCQQDDDCSNGPCINGACCAGDDFCPFGPICCDPDRSPTAACCPNGNGCCECFQRNDPGNERSVCCADDKICGTFPNDRCCQNDEVCLNGACYWEERVCSGALCENACCGDACCGPWETCGANGCETLPACTGPVEDAACGGLADCVPTSFAGDDSLCCPNERISSVNGQDESGDVTLLKCCPFGKRPGQNGNLYDCCFGPNYCGTSRGGSIRFVP